MTIDDLKTKLHNLFEHCGTCGVSEEIKLEEEVPSVQPLTTEQDYKSPTGIVYKISNNNGVITVKDTTGKVVDSFIVADAAKDGSVLKKDDRTAISGQLGLGAQPTNSSIPPTTPAETPVATTITEPTNAAPEPAEVKVAESKLEEVDEKVAANMKAQYGDDWKKIYYATANKQNRNPETFEKK